MALLDPMPQRIRQDLEPILSLPDPRPKISAYDSMPYAIFRYDPNDEFAMRAEIDMLQDAARAAREAGHQDLARRVPGRRDARRAPPRGVVRRRAIESGTDIVVDTVHEILGRAGRRRRTPGAAGRRPPAARARTRCGTWSSSAGQEPCSRSTARSRCWSSSTGGSPSRPFSSTPASSTARPGSSSWACSRPSTTTDRGSSDGGIVHGRRTDDQRPLRQRHRPQHRRGHQGRPAR